MFWTQTMGIGRKQMKSFHTILDYLIQFFNPVSTICPHGNPLLKREGWNSNKDFSEMKELNKYSHIADIVINPELFINDKLIYVSDAGFVWKQIANIKENDRMITEDIPISGLNELLQIVSNNQSGIILAHTLTVGIHTRCKQYFK